MANLGLLAATATVMLAAPALVAGAPPAHDGPFGLYMGEPISALERLTKDPSGILVVKAPRPAAALPIVSVEAYPNTGVCMIVAQTERIDDDPQGHRIRAEIDHLAGLLATKYGPYQKIDQCDGDADACSRFWLYKLSTHAAKYTYAWLRPTGVADIGVASVALTVQTNGGDRGAVAVLYSSADPACAAARTAADGAGL